MSLARRLRPSGLAQMWQPFKKTFASTLLEEMPFINELSNECIPSPPQSISTVTPSENSLPSSSATLPFISDSNVSTYNGHFALYYERNYSGFRTLDLFKQMLQRRIQPNTLAFNFVIAAHLRLQQRPEAYRRLTQMEAAGLAPDLLTFEILINEFSKTPSLAAVIEELVALMKGKYEIDESQLIRMNMVKAWLHARGKERLQMYWQKFVAEGDRAPAELWSHLLHVAIIRKQWDFAEIWRAEVSQRIANDRLIISTKAWQTAWNLPQLTIDDTSKPLLKFLMERLDSVMLDEGSYLRLVNYAAKTGDPHLGQLGLRKLVKICSNDGGLPQHYLEAVAMSVRNCSQPSVKDLELAARIGKMIVTNGSDPLGPVVSD